MATEGTEQKTIKIDGIYLEAHPTASGLREKKESQPYDQRALLIGRAKNGLKAKLNIFTDNKGQGVAYEVSVMTVGQVSGYTGTAALPVRLRAAKWKIIDRSHGLVSRCVERQEDRSLHRKSEVSRQSYQI